MFKDNWNENNFENKCWIGNFIFLLFSLEKELTRGYVYRVRVHIHIIIIYLFNHYSCCTWNIKKSSNTSANFLLCSVIFLTHLFPSSCAHMSILLLNSYSLSTYLHSSIKFSIVSSPGPRNLQFFSSDFTLNLLTITTSESRYHSLILSLYFFFRYSALLPSLDSLFFLLYLSFIILSYCACLYSAYLY